MIKSILQSNTGKMRSFHKKIKSQLFNNYGFSNNFKRLIQTYSFRNKRQNLFTCITIGTGIFFSYYLEKNKVRCVQRSQAEYAQPNQQSEIQIYQLNKYQFLELLTNVNEEMLLVVFDKYYRNENQKQFAQKFQKLYLQAKQLKVGKIYLIEKNDIKHLQTFEKWLSNQKNEVKQDKNGTKNIESKIEYFFLAPYFKNNPFKLEEEQINQEIQQIRHYQIRFNPKTNQEIFQNYRIKFNLNVVVKQCPQYVLPMKENECVEDYRTQIATLIQQKMLKNKSQQFGFYALLPNSKKDNLPISSFQNTLKAYKSQQKPLLNGQTPQHQDQKRNENMYVFRNDLLGHEIDNMKSFKKLNYSALKSLTSYEQFLLFIRPRIFIVSKANSSIDLYWYVTCLHKNRQPTVSINNTDTFNSGRKYPVTNGLSYPQNNDLDFLKLLYKNHPYLNFLVVDTEIVSELIRHLPVKKRYSIFSLNSDLIYPKMLLPDYDSSFSPSYNYNINFKPLIETYLKEPKNYDYIVLDKEKKVNRKELEQLVKRQNKKFILRVCSLNCQNDIPEEKLKMAYSKIKLLESIQYPQKNQTIQKIEYPKHWQKDVYRNTFWIDSHYNNVGLIDGDYVFSEGNFFQL